VRIAILGCLLVACGGATPDSTIVTHPTSAPSASAPTASLAFGEVRWIEVGTPVRDLSASARRVAAVLDDGSIVTFDLASGARATTRPADAAAPPTMPSISPDGSLLAHCVGTEATIIDVERGTFGTFSRDTECAAPALWSPDGARVYFLLRGNQILAFDVRSGALLGRGSVLGDAFVAADGSIVSEGDHRIAVLDASLAPASHETIPELDAQHGSPGESFLLGVVDASTFLYAAGEGSYDVVLVHEGTAPQLLWHSAQNERWDSVFPLGGERALLLTEREQSTFARIVNARTGQSLGETPDVGRPFDVAADGSIAAAGVAARIAVIGTH
jgi:hypothetical protein